jgi:hypothetical protein
LNLSVLRNQIRVPLLALTLSVIYALAPGSAQAATANVTSGADDGPGSFRAAVAAANLDPSIDRIRFARNLDVDLLSSVEYIGSQDLAIDGNGGTISGAGVVPAAASTWDGGLFVSRSAADISLRDIGFVDSFSNGVAVFIPGGVGGTVRVALDRVVIDSATFHGLLVDGQAFAGFYTDDIPHPNCVDPHFVDSGAAIDVTISRSDITNNGQLPEGYDIEPATGCPADFDGVRVDQGGAGDGKVSLLSSTFNGNLADGVELDETGDGSAIAVALGSRFNDNGDTGTIDPDDGFDIDEAGAGDIVASITASEMSGNFDEGLDLDEQDDGQVSLTVTGFVAENNSDEGIKIDELDEGSIDARITGAKITGVADQEGVHFVEEEEGNVEVRLALVDISNNAGNGIRVEEEEEGDFLLRIVASKLKANGAFGIRVDVEGPGSGQLTVIGSDLRNNADGAIRNDDGVPELIVATLI